MTTQSNIEFAKWLKRSDPFLFEAAKKYSEMEQAGGDNLGFSLPNFNIGNFVNSITDTVKKVAPALVQYKAQSAILKEQISRAKKGLPPLNADQYTPTVKVAATVTPEMEQAATRVAKTAMNTGLAKVTKMLPWVAIGLAGVLILKRSR